MPNDTMDDGMDSMYSSDSSQSNPPESVDEEEKEESGKTVLASKSALGDADKKVGDVCKFKVVADYGDEVELEYVPHETKSTKMTSDEEIDAMDQG